MTRQADVAVIGAGIFGACAAYFLRREKLRVILLDAFGVGHPRATSGGESRITRCAYGGQGLYTRWAWEALRDWKRWERDWKTEIFHNTGVAWLASGRTPYIEHSLRHLRDHDIPFEQLTTSEFTGRFPQFAPGVTKVVIYEPKAGVLLARKACRLVAAAFERTGGEFVQEVAEPPDASEFGRLTAIRTASGRGIAAGAFVFACGPWLPKLFPALVGDKISVSKQDVFFFGAPPGNRDFEAPNFPAWADLDEGIGFYGVPSLDGRGVKIANDHTGPPFDPTTGDRSPAPQAIAAARKYLGERFPALRGAPLLEVRVCQYERTSDSHLVIDRHPEMPNVWIAGGGSGHGFKLGPAVGRLLAARVLDGRRDKIPEEVRIA